jgi:stage II sporulation protein D
VGAKNGITQDEHCLVDKKSAWELKVPIDEIKTKLNLDKDVKDIQPIHFTASLRNEILRVTLSDGSYKDISAQGMRSYLGFSKLKSAAFKVERQSDNFLFTGRGYGHGAGLCQSGTRFMALGGANYKEILAKYFPRAQIVRKTQTVALKP